MTTKPPKTRMAGPHSHLTELPTPPKRPDAMKQRRHIAKADQILRSHHRHRNDVLVSGKGYLCYQAGEARRSPRPDCIVSFGLSIPPDVIEDVANGYVISEVGKPPEFVLEVASESTGQRDYTVKREIYARFEVKEYWRFDYTGGRFHDVPLAGDRLVDGGYEPIPVEEGADGIIRGRSAELGLELHWHFGQLRFWNPVTGEYLPDLVEALEALAEAEMQRDAAIAQRDAVTVQRDAAQERIQELEAELRRLQSGN
jgi:Uma2 family endonuclease